MTLVGSRVTLGSPAIDEVRRSTSCRCCMVGSAGPAGLSGVLDLVRHVALSPPPKQALKVSMVAVVSDRPRWRRLLPRPPDHLPGRPVQRLRRWAARARGHAWPQAGAMTGQQLEQQQFGGEGVEVAAGAAAAAAAAAEGGLAAAGAQLAPLPGEDIYMSHDDETAELEVEEYVMDAEAAASTYGIQGSSGVGGEPTAAALAKQAEGVTHDLPRQRQQLERLNVRVQVSWCKGSCLLAGAHSQPPGHLTGYLTVLPIQVTMAVRVPGPLQVVPNPLLGYAGAAVWQPRLQTQSLRAEAASTACLHGCILMHLAQCLLPYVQARLSCARCSMPWFPTSVIC